MLIKRSAFANALCSHLHIRGSCARAVLRRVSSSALRQDAGTERMTEASAAQESQDVAELDGLTKVIRSRANPAYHESMPMRSPIFWSDTLVQASLSSSSPPPSISSSLSLPSQSSGASLPPRHMHDSYSEIFLPFASTPALFDTHVNASGGLQTGKLLEHLDALAGAVAYKHMLGPDSGGLSVADVAKREFYLVTASVDRLDMLAPLSPIRDIRLSGQVIYVGRSSMEVIVKMEALEDGKSDQTLMLGRFSMVCRDARTHKAHNVNPLLISTPEENALYAMGEAHKTRRQSLAARSLTRVPPTSEEAAHLHEFFLNYGQDLEENTMLQRGEERVWMGDTRREVSQLMFPQERNIHQKVFGGYLMRLAYELGYANSTLFTRQPLRFISLDKISFARPVPIGSILRLTSHILHSTGTPKYPVLVHVGVRADVIDVKTGAERTTNDFRFTWAKEGVEPLGRKVVPKTYGEAMLWLEAQRVLEINTLLGKHRG